MLKPVSSTESSVEMTTDAPQLTMGWCSDKQILNYCDLKILWFENAFNTTVEYRLFNPCDHMADWGWGSLLLPGITREYLCLLSPSQEKINIQNLKCSFYWMHIAFALSWSGTIISQGPSVVTFHIHITFLIYKNIYLTQLLFFLYLTQIHLCLICTGLSGNTPCCDHSLGGVLRKIPLWDVEDGKVRVGGGCYESPSWEFEIQRQF